MRRARPLLVDSDADAVALALANITEGRFGARAAARLHDVASGGVPLGRFTSVIANPPYFATGQGTPASARGQAARHMPASDLALWVRAAAANAEAGGEAIFVLPGASLALALAAFEGRFGAITVLPLTPRPGTPASRILVRGIRDSRAPLVLLASRAVHGTEGQGFSPEFEAIFRGADVLHW